MKNIFKNFTKKDWIITASVGVFAIGAGFATGFLIKRYSTPVAIDYDTINILPYLPNDEEINKRYEDDKDLSHYTDAEVANIAQDKYRDLKNSITICKGTSISGIVHQTIRSNLLRNNNEYCEEAISSSAFVNLASRVYETLQNDTVSRYIGKVKTDETASYKENPEAINKEIYQDTYGKTPDKIFTYLISNKTVKSSKRSNKDNLIVLDLNMDPIYSTYFYVHQMKNVSNLGKYPAFEYVELSLEIEKDSLMLKKMAVKEKYYAELKSKVGSTLTSELEFTFLGGKVLNIPTPSEPMDYKTV